MLSHSEGVSLLSKVFRRFQGRNHLQNDVSPSDHKCSNVLGTPSVLVKVIFGFL